MEKPKWIFTILLFFGVTLAFPQKNIPYDVEKKYGVSDLKFDLEILKDALVKIHPGLFWYQSEKEFEDNYTKIKNAISSPMTEREFYILVTPFVSNIRCGHTDLAMSKAFDKYFANGLRIFPFSVRIIESKIYISRNYTSDTTVAIGSGIVSINGLSVDSILHLMESYAWTDGFTKSYARIESDFQLLLLSFFIFNNPDRYVLNTIDPAGNSRLIEAESLDFKTFNNRHLKRYAPDPNKKYEPFKFRVIDSLSTAVIRIDGFEGKGYQKFLANSFKHLKIEEVKI